MSPVAKNRRPLKRKNDQIMGPALSGKKRGVSLAWFKAPACHAVDRGFKSRTSRQSLKGENGGACTKGARMAGSQSVVGSIPISSTKTRAGMYQGGDERSQRS